MSDDETVSEDELAVARRAMPQRNGQPVRALPARSPVVAGAPCDVCGAATNCVGICRACREASAAREEEQRSHLVEETRRIIRAAKDRGVLGEGDRRWLLSQGLATTVKGLEDRFEREAEGGKRSRREDR